MYQRDLFPTLKRHLKTKETVVITGMRRVGKTTILRQMFDLLPEAENKLFLDLENPLNRKYFEDQDYDGIAATLSVLGINPRRRAFIFLDEAQYSPTLPSAIKYLSDHYQMKFFLTGSASFYLKHLFTESLAGRKRLFELYPLSFSEFLKFKEETLQLPKPLIDTEAVYRRIQRRYEEYVLFGGFPEVVLKTSAREKTEALQEIFTSYFKIS